MNPDISREEWRAMTPEQKLARSGAGFSETEIPVVMNFKRMLSGWMTDVEIGPRVNDSIASWAKELEERYSKNGDSPRRYKFFHALVGSTPPKDQEYAESPDLPGADSAVIKIASLVQEFGEPKAG